MEWLSLDFFSALLAIVVIDLVLAGDNAIVIGMAARNLPKEQQKKAIVYGTVGAIIIRALATLAVVYLLKIPGLLVAGGLMLIWIAYRLLQEDKEAHGSGMKAGTSLMAAIRTIVVADTVMGIDNVLAVAGAAHGSFGLVITGLVISVPLMVWGSSFVLKLMERFPSTIYIGAAVLAYTAGSMITSEALVKPYVGENPVIKWGIILVVIAGVLWFGRRRPQPAQADAHEVDERSAM
ncbi:TerC family protein [Brevibacillus fluminis]|uniref:TerC family protein n=1 Tax=Brevibacillus fluminis TaxID=511487 RepID=A0A3M8DRG9_9BACL|nr:TerC family protein [Brevibacillus fluminis]RNB90642.1 TerC family protein [Brevibacillus fluminis]